MKRILSTLSEKWPEYLLEILVLIIGIYGAFAMDEWNESRKENEIENKYLIALKEEFSFNQDQLEEMVILNEGVIKNTKEMIMYMSPTLKASLEENFLNQKLIAALGTEIQFRPNSGVLDEIISSGKLTIFKNERLRVLLASWSGELYKVKAQESEIHRSRYILMDYISKKANARSAYNLVDYYMKEIGPSSFKNENNKLLTDREFENHLMVFLGSCRVAQNSQFLSLEKLLKEILEHVENELE